VWCGDEQKQIEFLKSQNEDLLRRNQSFGALATEQAATIETLKQRLQTSIDLFEQNYIQEKLNREQHQRDAVIAYWCSWGTFSICPRDLVKKDTDKTLAPSHPYFYAGAGVVVLLFGIALSGLAVGVATVRITWLTPRKQACDRALQLLDRAAAEVRLVEVGQAELAKGRKQQEDQREESKKEKAMLDRLLEEMQAELEILKNAKMNEKARIDEFVVKYKRAELSRADAELESARAQITRMEEEIKQIEDRNANARRDLETTLELMNAAAIRRQAFGMVFRPDESRQHDPSPRKA
jgi:hypothetical protein